jgi:hypothetical protein
VQVANRETAEPGRFGLWWALGISVGLHVLLVLISFVFPLGSHSATPPEEEQSIEFTFADDEEEEQGRKRGEVPVPTPEQAAAPPPPVPEPTIPDRSPPPQVPVPEQPAQRPLEQPPVDPLPEPEKNEEPVEEQPTDAELEDLDDPTDEPETQEAEGSELEEQQVSPFASPGQPAPRQAPQPVPSINQALRQFREQVNATRPEPAARGTFENVFVPDLAELPLAGSPYAFLEHESRDFDFSDYDRQIYFLILFAWYERLYETSSEFEKWGFRNRTAYLDHRSKITFTIQKNGDVTGITLSGPAGCPPLDTSAMDALDEVILPPLPAEFPRDAEVIHATFLAQGDIRSLRPHFERMKRAGYF